MSSRTFRAMPSLACSASRSGSTRNQSRSSRLTPLSRRASGVGPLDLDWFPVDPDLLAKHATDGIARNVRDDVAKAVDDQDLAAGTGLADRRVRNESASQQIGSEDD
jgi:hypothetical protein